MTRYASILLLVALALFAGTQSAQAQQRWHFGMNVRLSNSQYGPLLQVVSVQPGSPAQVAGLEPGDQIYSVNNTTLFAAQNDFQAREILQRATGAAPGGGGVPTTRVVTQPGTARMQVLDVNTGGIVPVVCYPNYCDGGGGGIPTSVSQVFRAR